MSKRRQQYFQQLVVFQPEIVDVFQYLTDAEEGL